MALKRRHFLGAPLLSVAALEACSPAHAVEGGFTGIHADRGHQLRDRHNWPAPARTRQVQVAIVGAGVAGLAAARALRLRGIDDFVVLELEDGAGGNARAGLVHGLPCPLGAHYLPVPSDADPEVQNLLEELGLRKRVAGRWTYDEFTLCHSPQERLYIHGQWQEGLLPNCAPASATQAQYQRFAALVAQAQRQAAYQIPMANRRLIHAQQENDAITFAAWLDHNGIHDTSLRWYLDYCCRDDYGAGAATVSAWAGLHYFAARHGFYAPGDVAEADPGVLTWPEGNAWLTRQLAAPLGQRLQSNAMVVRVAVQRHGVEIDVWNGATLERWEAQRCIMALPLFIAARVVENPPSALQQTAQAMRYAPWLVANMYVDAPLLDRPGAAPAWDNVVFNEGLGGLGYVDAGHQRLDPRPAATVLTHYRALGDIPEARRQLLELPWTHWRDVVVGALSAAHPDLPQRLQRMELTRYGHAMAMPVPGLRSSAALAALAEPGQGAWRRLQFAHSDLSAYSIFEEAFAHGHRAGNSI